MRKLLMFSLMATTAVTAPLAWAGTSYPGKDWARLSDSEIQERMSSPACQKFKTALEGEKDQKEGLKTDSIVIVKGGVIQYESYDGVYTEKTPHCLWSASKTVTAALLASAIQEGVRTPKGETLSLESRLADFFPASERKSKGPNEHFYSDITLRDMIHMGANFDWLESYDGDIKDSHKKGVLGMLYGAGRFDVARFALQAPMRPEGPSNKYVYSGGNSNLISASLKKIYGKNYDSMPWKNLFDAVGMNKVIFEQDQAGTFIGSSYVHMTPRDMARFGYLHLHDGVWDGKRILPEGWVTMIQEVSPAMLAPATPTDFIKAEGIFGGTMWLNKDIRGLGKPFPNSPDDMYFAAGHYGQLIIVIPSKDLVIARTGHDVEYWSKIDKITKRAVRCFAPDAASVDAPSVGGGDE